MARRMQTFYVLYPNSEFEYVEATSEQEAIEKLMETYKGEFDEGEQYFVAPASAFGMYRVVSKLVVEKDDENER